jgi:hypothetical protein
MITLAFQAKDVSSILTTLSKETNLTEDRLALLKGTSASNRSQL